MCFIRFFSLPLIFNKKTVAVKSFFLVLVFSFNIEQAFSQEVIALSPETTNLHFYADQMLGESDWLHKENFSQTYVNQSEIDFSENAQWLDGFLTTTQASLVALHPLKSEETKQRGLLQKTTQMTVKILNLTGADKIMGLMGFDALGASNAEGQPSHGFHFSVVPGFRSAQVTLNYAY